MCQSVVRNTCGAVLSRPAHRRPCSLAAVCGGDPRAVDRQRAPAAARPVGGSQLSHQALKSPHYGRDELFGPRQKRRRESTIRYSQLPMPMPQPAQLSGHFETRPERLSFAPGHQEHGPTQPLRRPPAAGADRPLRKNELGRNSRIALGNCFEYDTRMFGPLGYAVVRHKTSKRTGGSNSSYTNLLTPLARTSR
jgi:hypothetical protein